MTHVALKTSMKRTLIEEIQRYLTVVDAFRALGAPPSWVSEALAAQRNPMPEGGDASAELDRSRF